MSRRARSSASPVSLFAFQDIITSVTAIMILLVLILTLELISRQKLKGIPPDDRRVAQELRLSMEAMRERLAALRSDTVDAKQTALRVAGQSPREIEATQQATQATNATLASGIASLEAQLAAAQKQRRAAESNLVALEKSATTVRQNQERAVLDHAAAQALEEKNRAEADRQRDVEKDLDEGTSAPSTLIFNPPQDGSLTPILTEVSSTGVAVFTADGDGVRDFGWGLLGPSSEFSGWLRARDKHREYIVIMLRPSGIEKFKPMRDAVLASGLQLGVELVSEEMDIVLGE